MIAIQPGAYVTHHTYGKGLRSFVKEVNDEETQALCWAQNEDEDAWLPVSELTLVEHAPSGVVPPWSEKR